MVVKMLRYGSSPQPLEGGRWVVEGDFIVVESAAKGRWRWAVRSVLNVLRLKRRFSIIGEWCKLDRVKNLCGHLARSQGELRHKNKNCLVEQNATHLHTHAEIKAKEKAKAKGKTSPKTKSKAKGVVAVIVPPKPPDAYSGGSVFH